MEHFAGKTDHGKHACILIDIYGGCHTIGGYLCLAILTSNDPGSTITTGRGRLECGKTIGPPSATACGPQDFCPPDRVRAEGGSCSAANGVPMVSRS